MNEVARIEQELKEAKKRAALALRSTRESLDISLRTAAGDVGLSAGALSGLERALSWQTSTARRVAKYLARKLA